jgi:hypothetical protein
MFSLRPLDWKKGWSLLLVLLGLVGFATVEPEAGEAVNAALGLSAIGCLLWMIWRLMQYDPDR